MEKDDQEYLHMVGVKDNAKVLLMEEQKTIERNSEEVEGNGFSSAAEVRPEKEVDYFSPRLVWLEVKWSETIYDLKHFLCKIMR